MDGLVTTRKDELLEKIKTRQACVMVVGLGYVGLPFAVEKAKVGFRVVGLDQNATRVDAVNKGRNYISDVNDVELQNVTSKGLLTATTVFGGIQEADVIVICVPTPLTKNLTPDLQYIENVTREIAKYLRPGQLVSLESTTYPGTTDEVMLPILQESGLTIEKDFFLVHSPERVDPGNERYTTKNTSKVVGAVGPNSLQIATVFYQQTIRTVVPISSAKAAELVKVFENTFRAVNIALVNEFTLLCDRMDLNVWEVLDAAFTKPFGIMPFYPGPGVGGHCIPIDPHYLEWKAKELNFNTRFIALAGEINRKMPEFVREKAIRVLNQSGISVRGAKILFLGVTYKKNLADCRESPALEVMKLLRQEGAMVSYFDPYVSEVEHGELHMSSVALTEEEMSQSDLVVITTNHDGIDYEWVVAQSNLILDTRHATSSDKSGRGKITLL